jgi:hypothetical protein
VFVKSALSVKEFDHADAPVPDDRATIAPKTSVLALVVVTEPVDALAVDPVADVALTASSGNVVAVPEYS